MMIKEKKELLTAQHCGYSMVEMVSKKKVKLGRPGKRGGPKP